MSIATAMTCPTSIGSTFASTSAHTVSGRPRAASVTAGASIARSMSAFSANGVFCSKPMRSVSVTTPRTTPDPSTTGT